MSIRRPNLFTGTAGRNLFTGSTLTTSSSTSSGEIDLREELDELFFGYESGIRHGYVVVIRNLRRDSTGKPVPCSCLQPITREADPDCSYCYGERYLFDENWAWTYSMYTGSEGGLANKVIYLPPGSVRVDYKLFFFRYDTDIKYGDKIIEMKLDEEGDVIVPYIRESIYLPQTIRKYRSDNGRIEYFGVYCREEDAIRSDTPE